MSTNLKEKVETVLNEIRPHLQADSGDAKLIGIDDDGTVRLRLVGACGACPMSQMTLKMGIERLLKEKIPEVKEVINV
jgi:Fe-S cluster biogenesis protein NfuA